MPAVMRHVKSPQPINPSEDPADRPPTAEERHAATRLLVHMVGTANARKRDLAARKAASTAKEKTMKPCTCKPAPNAAPAPPDMLSTIRKMREPAPLPDPYQMGKAAPVAEPNGVPAPPDFTAAVKAQRAKLAQHDPLRLGKRGAA